MRTLPPQRRRKILGACAAIIPASALLMESSHAPALHAVGGFFIGLALAYIVTNFRHTRRTCV